MMTPRHLAIPTAFYGSIRETAFAGKMMQGQVAGCNALIKACGNAGWNTAWTAYGLATAFHETNATMQPVCEAYWLGEDWRKGHLRYWPHYGRGYVQLTWAQGYRRADRELGLGGKLVADPDLALDPEIAGRILVAGMSAGWFTGKSLGTYLPEELGTVAQFTQARRIINGTDRAERIACEAINFQAALIAGGWT